MQLEDEVVLQNLITKPNEEWSDIASDVAEMSDFYFLSIVDPCKDILQGLYGVFFCGNENVNAARYVLQVGGNCFAKFWVKNVQENANFFSL